MKINFLFLEFFTGDEHKTLLDSESESAIQC